MIVLKSGYPGHSMTFDVASEIASLTDALKGSSVLRAVALASVAVLSARFVRRLFPVTRQSAVCLTPAYSRVLASGKLLRGLKYRRRLLCHTK